MRNYFLCLLLLSACIPDAGVASENSPIKFKLEGLGDVTQYKVSSGHSWHYIYKIDGQPTTTVNYSVGKGSNETIVIVGGVEYVPKTEDPK